MRHILVAASFKDVADDKKSIDRGEVTEHLNLICECVRGCLFLSDGIRKDVSVVIFDFDDKFIIVIEGSKLKYMGTDLRSISLLLIKAFKLGREGCKRVMQSTPGISVIKTDIWEYLKNNVCGSENRLYYYRAGLTVERIALDTEDFFLIVSLKKKMTSRIRDFAKYFKLEHFNFNSWSYLPNELIIVFNNYLDRMLNVY